MNFRRTFSDKPNAFRCKDTNSGYVFPLIVKNWKLLSPDIQRLKYLQKVCFIPDGCWCHVPQNKCMVKVENDFISPFQPNFHFHTPGKQNQVFKFFGNTEFEIWCICRCAYSHSLGTTSSLLPKFYKDAAIWEIPICQIFGFMIHDSNMF